MIDDCKLLPNTYRCYAMLLLYSFGANVSFLQFSESRQQIDHPMSVHFYGRPSSVFESLANCAHLVNLREPHERLHPGRVEEPVLFPVEALVVDTGHVHLQVGQRLVNDPDRVDGVGLVGLGVAVLQGHEVVGGRGLGGDGEGQDEPEERTPLIL